jgi:hypothetical protein
MIKPSLAAEPHPSQPPSNAWCKELLSSPAAATQLPSGQGNGQASAAQAPAHREPTFQGPTKAASTATSPAAAKQQGQAPPSAAAHVPQPNVQDMGEGWAASGAEPQGDAAAGSAEAAKKKRGFMHKLKKVLFSSLSK